MIDLTINISTPTSLPEILDVRIYLGSYTYTSIPEHVGYTNFVDGSNVSSSK